MKTFRTLSMLITLTILFGFATISPASASGPIDLINDLIADVESMNLQQGINNSLDAKLDAALQALADMNDNNDAAATNALNAFINAVEAQRGNKITESQADILIGASQAVINAINNPLSSGCQALNLYAPSAQTHPAGWDHYFGVTLNAGEIVHVELTGTVDVVDVYNFLYIEVASITQDLYESTGPDFSFGDTETISLDFTVAADGEHFFLLGVQPTLVDASITCTAG